MAPTFALEMQAIVPCACGDGIAAVAMDANQAVVRNLASRDADRAKWSVTCRRTLMRVFMPLRGRATARNFPKFLDGLRSHIGSCSLEGPLWSRARRLRGADSSCVPRVCRASAVGTRSRVLTALPLRGAEGVWRHHGLSTRAILGAALVARLTATPYSRVFQVGTS
jgi:hypothetical protein